MAARPAARRSSPRRPGRVWVPVALVGLVVVVVLVALAGGSPSRRSGTVTSGPLAPGRSLPAVVLPATTGHTVDLAAFRGKRNVLLYFYEHAG